MTRMPGVEYRPLSRTQTQPKMKRHDIVCLHTMVGTLTGTNRMFMDNGWGGTESHFGVGGKWGDGRDGEILQWQDTEFSADANYDGNSRVISIETGDNFPQAASDIEPWTPKQIASIVRIVVWACKTYDIPAVQVPDSKPGRRGIAYHRQGCEHSRGVGAVPGFLVEGGERWSTRRGKECPGPKRIAQIPLIIRQVKAALTLPTIPATPDKGDDEMQWTDKVALTETDAKVWTEHGKADGLTRVYETRELVSVSDMIRYPTQARKTDLRVRRLEAIAAQQAALLTDLLTLLKKDDPA